MEPVAPAVLALGLGPSHDVREILRAEYGTLTVQGASTELWNLTPEQGQHVREALAGHEHNQAAWSLEPGETVRRRDLQDTYGGSPRSGIVTLSTTRDILVLTDPVKGARFGYDRHDGLHPDGTYTYTA